MKAFFQEVYFFVVRYRECKERGHHLWGRWRDRGDWKIRWCGHCMLAYERVFADGTPWTWWPRRVKP